MESPCRDVCVPDAARDVCTGCRRTLDEIGRWSTMSDSERARIMAELPRRWHEGPNDTFGETA